MSPFSLHEYFETDLLAKILSQVTAEGKEGAFVGGSTGKIWPWKVINFRRPPLNSLEAKEILKQGREPDFWLRHRYDLEWSYSKDVDCSLVEPLISKLEGYYKCLTRVSALVQKPGMEIPPHKDKVAGTDYNEGIVDIGVESLNLINDYHIKNDFLCIKVPLIFDISSYGKPYYIEAGKQSFYNFGSSAFVMDEYNIQHGVEAVAYWRGVLVLDGLLNLEKVYGRRK